MRFRILPMINAGAVLIALMAMTLAAQDTPANNGGTPPKDPAVVAAEEEAARVAARNKLVLAQTTLIQSEKALAAAAVPNLSMAPGNAGAIGVTGTPVEGVAMAYEALQSVSGKMAKEINCGCSTIVLFSKGDLDALDSFRAWEAQTRLLKGKLDEAIKLDESVLPPGSVRLSEDLTVGPFMVAGASVAALSAIGPSLEALNKLISVFRVDTTLKYDDVAHDEKALVASLAPKLGDDCKVFYPAAIPVGLNATSTPVEDRLKEIRDQRDALTARVPERTRDRAEAEDKLKDPDTTDKAHWQTYLDQVVALLKIFETAVTSANAVEMALLKADDASGLSQLVKLRRAASFGKLLDSQETDHAYTVQVSVHKLASNTRTKKNVFLGDRLSFAGGVVASFIEYRIKGGGEEPGQVVKSGVFEDYTPYRKQGEPKAKSN